MAYKNIQRLKQSYVLQLDKNNNMRVKNNKYISKAITEGNYIPILSQMALPNYSTGYDINITQDSNYVYGEVVNHIYSIVGQISHQADAMFTQLSTSRYNFKEKNEDVSFIEFDCVLSTWMSEGGDYPSLYTKITIEVGSDKREIIGKRFRYTDLETYVDWFSSTRIQGYIDYKTPINTDSVIINFYICDINGKVIKNSVTYSGTGGYASRDYFRFIIGKRDSVVSNENTISVLIMEK